VVICHWTPFSGQWLLGQQILKTNMLVTIKDTARPRPMSGIREAPLETTYLFQRIPVAIQCVRPLTRLAVNSRLSIFASRLSRDFRGDGGLAFFRYVPAVFTLLLRFAFLTFFFILRTFSILKKRLGPTENFIKNFEKHFWNHHKKEFVGHIKFWFCGSLLSWSSVIWPHGWIEIE